MNRIPLIVFLCAIAVPVGAYVWTLVRNDPDPPTKVATEVPPIKAFAQCLFTSATKWLECTKSCLSESSNSDSSGQRTRAKATSDLAICLAECRIAELERTRTCQSHRIEYLIGLGECSDRIDCSALIAIQDKKYDLNSPETICATIDECKAVTDRLMSNCPGPTQCTEAYEKYAEALERHQAKPR